MIPFIKGIFFDQQIRCSKMISGLTADDINKDIDSVFFEKTIEMLTKLRSDIQNLIDSGDLDIDQLAVNNFIRYNTFHETLQTIELFRYLVIINYGEPEVYFKRKIDRIYKEIDCLQKQPIITTISNSDDYYWALPNYDIIAVPSGEERSLLNLPDLFHEMGHLIFKQYDRFLKGEIEQDISNFYDKEYQRIIYEQRSVALIDFYQSKRSSWVTSWIMEFVCDLIATYLVGPSFAWTNLKITALSSGKSKIFMETKSHPSDESRMRAIMHMLEIMGHKHELSQINESWNKFLSATSNPVPQNYKYTFPDEILQALARYVLQGCADIGLKVYADQLKDVENPISKILNDAWNCMLTTPEKYAEWEKIKIDQIKQSIDATYQ